MPIQSASTTSNRRTAFKLLGVIAASFAFGFALVPLYDVFCELTGLNGKTPGPAKVAAAPAGGATNDARRVLTVEFTHTAMPGLPWAITPLTARLDVHPGELHQVSYRVHNLSDKPIVAQAVPSVSPGVAAASFEKLECFCFSRQPLEPGETKDLPLAFMVKADVDKDVRTITLAYAFFKVEDAAQPAPATGTP